MADGPSIDTCLDPTLRWCASYAVITSPVDVDFAWALLLLHIQKLHFMTVYIKFRHLSIGVNDVTLLLLLIIIIAYL